MKKKLLPLALILFSAQLFAQWTVIPGTQSWNCNEMEMTDDYIFISKLNSNDDEGLVRYQKSTAAFVTMNNPHGTAFTKYGWKKMAAIDSHIIYTDKDSTFVTHNYGQSWTKAPLLNESGMYFMAAEGIFFLGGSRKLNISLDSGRTYAQLYYENFYTSTTLHPLLYHDSTIYFSQKRGLVKMKINEKRIYTIDDTSGNFYSLAMTKDSVIGCTAEGDIFNFNKAMDQLNLVNAAPFGKDFINEIYFDDPMVYAIAVSNRFQVSFDNGRSFTGMNNGLPSVVSIRRIKTDSTHVYLGTSQGVYKRSKSELNNPVGYTRLHKTQIHVDAYPIPATNQLNLSLPSDLKSNISLSLFDSRGKEIYTHNYQAATTLHIPINHLTKGIYFYSVQTANGHSVGRFVKD